MKIRKNIVLSAFAMSILFFIACSKEESQRSLFGTFTGKLTISHHYNPINKPIEIDSNATVSIGECGDQCFELNIFHKWGGVSTEGVFKLQNTFYDMIINPVLDMDGINWGYEDGIGTYDFKNNSLNLRFVVTDESAPFGTDSVYMFEGVQK